MPKTANLQIDATLAIREVNPHMAWSWILQWQRALDKLVEVNRYIDSVPDQCAPRGCRDVQCVDVLTTSLTLDVTDCDDVPQAVRWGEWCATIDWEDCETVDGRRIVRFDVKAKG